MPPTEDASSAPSACPHGAVRGQYLWRPKAFDSPLVRLPPTPDLEAPLVTQSSIDWYQSERIGPPTPCDVADHRGTSEPSRTLYLGSPLG